MVPVITIYEVSKKRHRGHSAKVVAYAETVMCRGRVIDSDCSFGRETVTFESHLAVSQNIAAAQPHRTTLWTQDQHFEGRSGVQYFLETDA